MLKSYANNLFQKYKNTECFVESGSHVGDGIQRALDAGFKNIISIELSPNYYYHCILRFNKNNFVHLYLGDTEDVLEKLITPINDTAWGKHESPLMQELAIIKKHPIKTHTLIIDDLRCWEKPHYDFDKNDILSFVKSINPEYEIAYEDGHIKNDIMVAYIKNLL